MADVIAQLLELDPGIVTTTLQDTCLTDIAAEWQVIDIWSSALVKAGLQPTTIFSTDRRKLLSTHYNQHAYTSTSDGVCLAMTRNPGTGRTCLVVDEIRNPLPESFGGLILDADMREEYMATWGVGDSSDQLLLKLTEDWPYRTPLDGLGRGRHCQISTSPLKVDSGWPRGDECIGNSSDPAADDVWDQSPNQKYDLEPIDGGGGLELVIEIDEIDGPWESLCGAIKARGQFHNVGTGDTFDRFGRDLMAVIDADEEIREEETENSGVDLPENAATAAGWA